MNKTLLLGGSVVRESGIEKADVLISITGEIETIGDIKDHKNCDIIDCTEKLLFPLLIDCHVHFREPGLEHKATMHTEATAALSAGIGCVCEMPNTIPPTVTIAALADKVRRASLIDGCTMKFFFGTTEAAHLWTLRDLWTGSSMELKKLKHHCSGLKLYLDHSTGDQKVDGGIVDDVFKTCAELKIPLVAHCEDAEMNAEAKTRVETRDARVSSDISQGVSTQTIALHSHMRPPESEAKAIEEALILAKKYGTPFHVAHLSTALGIDLIRQAKKEKISVTCEVAPHHLFLTTDDYAKLGSLAKMNPPLRSAADRDALWAGIADGTVDCISTDHAPHTLEEKRQETSLLSDVPSGVPGVETMLPLLLTEAAKNKISYADIVRLCFTNPNRIFALSQPNIEQGSRARIAIIDPKKEWILEGKNLKTKCEWTPFEGWSMTGSVEQVIAH